MRTTDMNERVKELLAPFLITDWNILPCEDLDTEVKEMNQSESSIKITDANILLWFAKGHHGSTFFLKDYSMDSKIPGVTQLPTEYMGALIVHRNKKCILSASWHGYEFLMMDEIKTSFGSYPISKTEVTFCSQIAEVLSS